MLSVTHYLHAWLCLEVPTPGNDQLSPEITYGPDGLSLSPAFVSITNAQDLSMEICGVVSSMDWCSAVSKRTI